MKRFIPNGVNFVEPVLLVDSGKYILSSLMSYCNKNVYK